MTWGELDKYAMEELTAGINNVIDWRPAGWLYINDIVKAEDNEAFIPFGIRYWLANGDSIIYVKAQKDGEVNALDKSKQRTAEANNV